MKSAPSLAMPVDVGRPVAHDAVVVGADVVDADVVAPDDEDVGLAGLRVRDASTTHRHGDEAERDAQKTSGMLLHTGSPCVSNIGWR